MKVPSRAFSGGADPAFRGAGVASKTRAKTQPGAWIER